MNPRLAVGESSPSSSSSFGRRPDCNKSLNKEEKAADAAATVVEKEVFPPFF